MIKKYWIALLVSSWIIGWASLAQAFIGLCCAHCGGNMPLNIPGGGIPEPKEFRFKLSQMYMQMGPLREGTEDLDNADLLGMPNGTTFAAVPSEMRMFMTMGSAAYSFTDDFAGMMMLGYIRNEMPMEFNAQLQGMTGERGFTMFSDGVSDITLLGKYRLFSDDSLAPTHQLSTVFGLTLPTGSIEQEFSNNPVPGQNGTIQPFKMQTGSGTVDPIFGLTYQASSDPFWYGANLLYKGHWYDNSQGYHAGQEFRYDLYLMRQVHQKVVLQAQFNGKYEGKYSDEPERGRIDGEGHAGGNPNNPFLSPLFDPDNYGGHKLGVSLGVQFQPFPMHIVELNGILPIYQDLNGPQLRDDWGIQFTYYIEIPTKKSRRHTGIDAPRELGF